jgi:hypothetical protein
MAQRTVVVKWRPRGNSRAGPRDELTGAFPSVRSVVYACALRCLYLCPSTG